VVEEEVALALVLALAATPLVAAVLTLAPAQSARRISIKITEMTLMELPRVLPTIPLMRISVPRTFTSPMSARVVTVP
jgi:hypothetical protein